jgi:cytochrome c oxidase subunit IV
LLSVDVRTESTVVTRDERRSVLVVLRQWPLILVLLVLGAGLVLVLIDSDYRRGTIVFAAAPCLAALLRAVLPDQGAGALRVRSRWSDVITLALLGAGALLASFAVTYDWDVDLLRGWFGGES